MAGWHQTIIIGNVGRIDGLDESAENTGLRYTQGGAAVFNFSVAVTERWNDRQSNERREKTTWYKVTLWNQQAENLSRYIEVGKQVMVTGNVEAEGYMNRNGEPAASIKLTARDVQLLGNRGDAPADAGQGAPMTPNNDIPFF